MSFIRELQQATLLLNKFQFYMLQDAKYLEHFGRVLAFIGSRCQDNTRALDFFEFGLTIQQHIPIESVCHLFIKTKILYFYPHEYTE
ncbi:thiaminase II/PqqC family protein [Sphingobacterium lumbrici]|uniref:hypothetical protein n=1 Tax=Sphingobacterium lumbrici TaxID=2559600 RepID=UPI001128F4F7